MKPSYVQGVTFSRVWITQWSTRDAYEVGDSALLQCNISSHGEIFSECKINWVIINQNNRRKTINLLTVKRYEQRVHIHTNGSLTIDKLTVNDTEPLYCTAICLINRELKQISGSGTSIIITGELHSYITVIILLTK